MLMCHQINFISWAVSLSRYAMCLHPVSLSLTSLLTCTGRREGSPHELVSLLYISHHHLARSGSGIAQAPCLSLPAFHFLFPSAEALGRVLEIYSLPLDGWFAELNAGASERESQTSLSSDQKRDTAFSAPVFLFSLAPPPPLQPCAPSDPQTALKRSGICMAGLSACSSACGLSPNSRVQSL